MEKRSAAGQSAAYTLTEENPAAAKVNTDGDAAEKMDLDALDSVAGGGMAGAIIGGIIGGVIGGYFGGPAGVVPGIVCTGIGIAAGAVAGNELEDGIKRAWNEKFGD